MKTPFSILTLLHEDFATPVHYSFRVFQRGRRNRDESQFPKVMAVLMYRPEGKEASHQCRTVYILRKQNTCFSRSTAYIAYLQFASTAGTGRGRQDRFGAPAGYSPAISSMEPCRSKSCSRMVCVGCLQTGTSSSPFLCLYPTMLITIWRSNLTSPKNNPLKCYLNNRLPI